MARRIVIAAKSARVKVVAGGDQLVIRGAPFTEEPDGTIKVETASASVDIACPPDCDVVIGVVSGRVETHGRLGAVRVSTVSGRVAVDSASELDVRGTSGRVEVGSVDGLARCSVTSGRVAVGHAGSVDVSVRSGRVVVNDCGDARVHAFSGRVELGARAGANIDVRTTSGRVAVTLPRGCCPATDVKVKRGRVDCSCPLGEDGKVAVQSVSGRVTIDWRDE